MFTIPSIHKQGVYLQPQIRFSRNDTRIMLGHSLASHIARMTVANENARNSIIKSRIYRSRFREWRPVTRVVVTMN